MCWACVVRDVLRRTEQAKRSEEPQEAKQPHYSEGRIWAAYLPASFKPPGG